MAVRVEQPWPGGHQGPLCASYHQVVSDGTTGLPLSGEGEGVGGGEVKKRGSRRGVDWNVPRKDRGCEREEKKGEEKERGCLRGRRLDHPSLSHRCTAGEMCFTVMTQ